MSRMSLGKPAALVALLLSVLGGARADETVTVAGTVRDSSGRPVAGAAVAAEAGPPAVTTDDGGAFRLALPLGPRVLRVSHPDHGSRTVRLDVTGGTPAVEVVLPPLTRVTDEVVVQAVRAGEEVPVTKSDISREDLHRADYGQEVPFLLKDIPSLTQYADGGAASGYSYMYIRGVQQTRLNMTLDGVPLSEPEDSALYFVDFADFASSLESVQVQRGVGTSSVGSASYGGSINFASLDFKDQRAVDGRFTFGSYGTARGGVGVQSGRLGSGLKLYARAAYQTSDGYRRNSGITQQSLFYGASYQDDSSFLKVFGFAGREKSQLAYLAVERDVLEQDPRTNPLSPDEKDDFHQTFAQAQYTRFLSDSGSLAAQVFYNGAGGWYRIYADAERTLLNQYGLDWHVVGASLTYKERWNDVSLTATGYGSTHGSTHRREEVGGDEAYRNRGFKSEVNGFVKLSYDPGRFHLYGDAQVRWARFRYEGDLPLGSVSWTFVNPKLGARYTLTPDLSVYASWGRTEREPARADLLYGEDNASVLYDLRGVRPERVNDFELGLEAKLDERVRGSLNFYAMEFRNEIALTGELSEIGLPVRRNVARSFRRGAELQLQAQPLTWLRLRHSSGFCWAEISEWPQSIDVYGEDGSYLTSEIRVSRGVRPLLTPRYVGNLGFDATVVPGLEAGVSGRYQTRAYLDNTATRGLTAPGFFTLDASASLDVSRWVKAGKPRLRLTVENVLDRRRYPSGYSYQFDVQSAAGTRTSFGTPYLYPLSGRGALLTLELGL